MTKIKTQKRYIAQLGLNCRDSTTFRDTTFLWKHKVLLLFVINKKAPNRLEECLIKTKKAPASNAAQNNDALLCVFSASVVREFNPECPCFPPYFLLERNH